MHRLTATLSGHWRSALSNRGIMLPAAGLVSGLLLGIATTGMISWLGWVCLVPLFFALGVREKILLPAVLAGLAYGLVMESWVYATVISYTGGNWGIALICHGVAVIIMAFKIVLMLLAYGLMRRLRPAFRILLWPLAATLIEASLYSLFEGFPWFQYPVGFSQAKNLYLCQLVELGDVYLLTFVVLMLNLLICNWLRRRNLKLLALPVCLLLVVNGYGALRVHQVEQLCEKTFNVAIVNDNSSFGLRWTREQVDEYADRILDLAGRVEDRGQVVNIWNEGVLPWSYRSSDDLLRAILKSTPTPSGTLHLIGMCSQDAGHCYNSAYVLHKDGTVVGRYDKQNLLKGLELPALGCNLPFFEASPFEVPPTEHRGVVQAEAVRMGIIICNEGISSRVAATFSDTPYDLLVLIANDNWFSGTPLIAHHFYHNRMRAIQCRKDLVINTNQGISGHVSATGAIVHRRRDSAPFVEYYEIHTHGEHL